jgi:uncharacterized protein YecE (DUF72 family)
MIHVGIGGWTYPDWRNNFYPPGLPHARELEFASRHVTSIEINGTFYRTQTPESFRRWAADTPDDFVFTVKAPGAVVNRRVLAETGPAIARFVESGIAELGKKLGPILWQFAPTRHFDAAEISAFFEMLPREADGQKLRHAVEVRHASFADPAFLDLARKTGAAIVYGDAKKYPSIADLTGDFVYARLQRADAAEPDGYPAAALDLWAARARLWAAGRDPDDLPHVGSDRAGTGAAETRPVFLFFISGAKERNPAAAAALIARLAEAVSSAND